MADEEEEKIPVEWEGPLQDGVPHGEGKATFPNGDIFQGTYLNGIRQGKGKYIFKQEGKDDEEEEERPYYEGDYADNVRHGHGIMKYPDGSRYEGQWENGKRHGQGTYTYPSGDMYDGGWCLDKKSGQGTYVFKESLSQFLGDWVGGNFVRGEWVLRDGTVYAGSFEANQPNGLGWFTLPHTGNVVEGYYGQDGKWVSFAVKRTSNAPLREIA